MAFADPDVLKSRLAKPKFTGCATIECGAPDSRSGVIVRIDRVKRMGDVELLLVDCFERVAGLTGRVQRISDPGWWAGQICMQATMGGVPAMIMRGSNRSALHACLVVERGGLVDAHPDWPRVRLGLSPLLDLRGESSCAVPSDLDLKRYAASHGVELDVIKLRNMFELGVIDWSSDVRGGRRELGPTYV